MTIKTAIRSDTGACAIVTILVLVSTVLGDEQLPVRYYDRSFPTHYADELSEEQLATGRNFTAALSVTAQGTAFNGTLYPNGTTNDMWWLIDMADTFFKVASANESLTDLEQNNVVQLPERASIIRHLTNGQPTYVFKGLISKFREAVGTRCGAFPRGCYATPKRLNKASEDLNEFLDSFYSKLVDAFNRAASKLDQNQYSDDQQSVCTPENIARIWCEVESLQMMMGDECGNASTIDCSPPRESLGCVWREIDTDDFDNMAYTVRIRLIHLVMANAFCGHKGNRSVEMGTRLLSVAKGFLNAERTKSLGMLSDSQEIDDWMGKILGAVDGAAGKLGLPQGYPNSSDVVSNYTLLAKNISQALYHEWGAYSAARNLSKPLDEAWTTIFCESFGSFVFFPGQESDYALPAKTKILKDKWGKEEVQDTLILVHPRPEANITIWKRIDTCSDSDKRDWIKENEAQLVKTLGKWSKEHVSALQSKVAAFKSNSRSWQECFRGVAIVKCAYRFVWYELGWTYFHATSDCAGFCVKTGGGGYRDQCLTIVFLG